MLAKWVIQGKGEALRNEVRLSHFPVPCPCSQDSCWDPLQWKDIVIKEYGIMHEFPSGWNIIYHKYRFLNTENGLSMLMLVL